LDTSSAKFATTLAPSKPAPINRDWVVEGEPKARSAMIFSSSDGSACTIVWDCTAGRFTWRYDIDETVCIVEGSVNIRDSHGATRTLCAGDVAFFPRGSVANWHIETYVRKVAYCHVPLNGLVALGLRALRRALRRLKSMLPSAGAPSELMGS